MSRKRIYRKQKPMRSFTTLNGLIIHKNGEPLKAGDLKEGEEFLVQINTVDSGA